MSERDRWQEEEAHARFWWDIVLGTALIFVFVIFVSCGIWLAVPPKATGKYYVWHGNGDSYSVWEYMRFTMDQRKFVTTDANKAYEVVKELEAIAKAGDKK